MPKLRYRVPSYRKHRASGQAVVTLAGKDFYLGRYGSPASRASYERLIAEYLSAGRSAAPSDENEISVTEVLAAYWRYAKKYYVKDGVTTNELDAMRLVLREVKRLYGEQQACRFGPKALKAVRQIWIDRGQARPTVNKNTRRVTRIFRWAVAEELVPPSVHQGLAAVPGLKKGRCDAPEPPPVLPAEIGVVEQTLPFLVSVTRDMVRLQLLTGMRPGEVCRLRPVDLDRSADVWEYRVAGHKTEHHARQRTVYIGPHAQKVLAPYLGRDAGQKCFSPREAVSQQRALRGKARVTPHRCGNRQGTNRKRKPSKKAGTSYTPASYRRAVHYACDQAFPPPDSLRKQPDESRGQHFQRLSKQQLQELRDWQKAHRWSPNQLRHTKATEVRRLFGLEAAQVVLGHAAADVTQVYAERDAEKARQVAREIG